MALQLFALNSHPEAMNDTGEQPMHRSPRDYGRFHAEKLDIRFRDSISA